jgi:hypothetical protein
MAQRVNNVKLYRKDFYDKIGGSLDETYAALEEFAAVVSDTVTLLFQANTDGLSNRLDAATASVEQAVGVLDTLDQQTATLTNDVNGLINGETAAVNSAKGSVSSMIASLSTTVAVGINAANTDRTNMRSTMIASNPGTVVGASISSQVVAEANRETTLTGTRSTSAASARASKSNAVASSLSSEYSRFDSACTAKSSNFNFGFQTQDGALDDTTWFDPLFPLLRHILRSARRY